MFAVWHVSVKIFASPFPHHRHPAPPPSSQQQDLELTGHACLQEKRAREEMLQKQSIREQIWKEESPNKVPVYGFGLVCLACRLHV